MLKIAVQLQNTQLLVFKQIIVNLLPVKSFDKSRRLQLSSGTSSRFESAVRCSLRPLLHEISVWIGLQILLTTYKIINGFASSYLQFLTIATFLPATSIQALSASFLFLLPPFKLPEPPFCFYYLHSSSQCLLSVSTTSATYENRAFYIAAPRLWHTLPHSSKLLYLSNNLNLVWKFINQQSSSIIFICLIIDIIIVLLFWFLLLIYLFLDYFDFFMCIFI